MGPLDDRHCELQTGGLSGDSRELLRLLYQVDDFLFRAGFNASERALLQHSPKAPKEWP